MVRIAIVEDEEIYSSQLRKFLEQYQKEYGEEIDITIYQDGDTIVEKYKAQFDIILMDIQMKFMDGMEAAEEIRKKDSEVIIIFITNMTQYAIRGYEVDALDYVLKPVSYFAFSQSISRAIRRIQRKSSRVMMIQVKGGLVRQDVSDIYYVESQGHNIIYHTSQGEHLSSGTMKAVEEILIPLGFSRGNKGYLINLNHVDGIQDKCAVVKGELLPLSRSRITDFMQDLVKYWGDRK